MAYQNSFPSLITPTELSPKEGELNLSHRFYGAVNEDPLDTFFGMNNGANVAVNARFNVMHGVELKAGFTRANKQYDLGSSWKFSPQDFPVRAQIDVQFMSFVQPGITPRRENLMYLLSLQQERKLWDRLAFTVNAGFDGYYERLIDGVGMQIGLTESLTLLGEYYPVLDRNSADPAVAQYLGKNDAYAIALKADTYGHHFIFSFGNSASMNPRLQSLGTDSNKVHFGFNIQRRLGM
jgi:hypothetical protein